MTETVLATDIPGLPLVGQGKVRDVYAVGQSELLLVATDRISAFDVVMAEGIPDKGKVLTKLSQYWFETTRDVMNNHFISSDMEVIAKRLEAVGVSVSEDLRALLAGRSLLCRRTKALTVEAVVRGYLSGSGWKAYQASRVVGEDTVELWGHPLPDTLVESGRLPKPLFTPSTKALHGHDEPLTLAQMREMMGESVSHAVEQAALTLYRHAAERTLEYGIILADTKFEFGVLPDGTLLLIDEALTPDSSRFWEASTYEPGKPQPSFDKQFVRDYLETVPGWDKQAPAPPLPPEIVEKTAEKYREAYRRVTGQDWIW